MILPRKKNAIGWSSLVYDDNAEEFQDYKLKTIEWILIEGKQTLGPIPCHQGSCMLVPISGLATLTQLHAHSLPSTSTLDGRYPNVIRVKKGDAFEIFNHCQDDMMILLFKNWDETKGDKR